MSPARGLRGRTLWREAPRTAAAQRRAGHRGCSTAGGRSGTVTRTRWSPGGMPPKRLSFGRSRAVTTFALRASVVRRSLWRRRKARAAARTSTVRGRVKYSLAGRTYHAVGHLDHLEDDRCESRHEDARQETDNVREHQLDGKSLRLEQRVLAPPLPQVHRLVLQRLGHARAYRVRLDQRGGEARERRHVDAAGELPQRLGARP